MFVAKVAMFSYAIVFVSLFTICNCNQALRFTVEPNNVVATEGKSVLLPCEGELTDTHGSSTRKNHKKRLDLLPSIRWRGPDGQDIGVVGDTFRMQLENGSLYISSVEENRGLTGAYQCLLSSDGIGTIVSRSAIVSIAKIPETNNIFSEQYLFPGQTAFFKCLNASTLPSNFHNYHIQWLKDDIPLNIDDTRMVLLPSGAIEIDELTADDKGAYYCNVTSGSFHKISSKTYLNIKTNGELQTFQAPTFQTDSTSKTVIEGTAITLDCVANGNPKPQIKWLRNGEDIDFSDLDSRFRIVGTGSLRIQSAVDEDSGNYQCRASNSIDSTDIQVSVQVQVPPKFIQSPTDKVAFEKDELEMVCEIRGKPTPIVQWLKNGDVIKPNDYMQIVNGHNLRILGLLESDAGMFQCIGTNPAGSVQAAARLQIGEQHGNAATKALLPGPPRDLVAQIVNPRFVTLSWLEPTINPDEVVNYSVYYKMNTSDRERKMTTKSRDEQMANIQSLLPGRTYQFRVVGNSNHGSGTSSEIFEVKTQPEENIAGPPQGIVGRVLSHKEIYVKWSPPLITNGNITKYRVYFSTPDTVETFAETLETEAILTELRPFTEYTIYTIAFNENGMGDSSNEIVLKTFSSSPDDAPHNVTLEATSSTSITVRWEPPPIEMQNGQITGYKIRYRKHKKPVQVETTPANMRHFELRNLDRKSSYQVKIAAMTVNGTGPFTEWHLIDTYENDLTETHVPGKPAWIQTRASSKSILVKWGAPERQDIKVRNYILGYGVGVPDVDTVILDAKQRSFEIADVSPNEEYVLSLRARNSVGDGEPQYANIATRDEDPIEPNAGTVLEVPVRLRAITMSSSSIVVYWTDNSVTRTSNGFSNNKFYMVRYNPVDLARYKYYNTTDMNCMIDDLRPNTQYEFAVKAIKGRRESAWSMSEVNTTFPLSPVSPPRELSAQQDPKNPQNIILTWLAPRNANEQINGYIVFYTTDPSNRDRDWNVEAVAGDKTEAVIKNLKPRTLYYFKVQARNANRMAGTFSAMISYTIEPMVSLLPTIETIDSIPINHKESEKTVSKPISGFAKIFNEYLIYIVALILLITLIVSIRVVMILCKPKPEGTPDAKHKSTTGIKPPDLWIHHDQMELKNVEKNPPSDAAGSSSGAMTLPRPSHDYESETSHSHVTNSLDKRSYLPGYMTTSMTSTLERNSHYPRPYNRIHIDSGVVQSNTSQTSSIPPTPENPYSYDSMPSNYSNPSITYAPGLAIDVPKAPRGQGHPLQSFTVPGPPPSSLNTTPLISNPNKHNIPAVAIRPQNSSPYKKSVGIVTASIAPISATNTLNRLQQSGPIIAHSNDEIQRLAPSTSTEELNQEMANLEGLMKDLSAITASEFEC